ncbi:MAG: hypothetical protein Q8Q01_05270 [archaeon]|nr:hypothetical protein [archaeon]
MLTQIILASGIVGFSGYSSDVIERVSSFTADVHREYGCATAIPLEYFMERYLPISVEKTDATDLIRGKVFPENEKGDIVIGIIGGGVKLLEETCFPGKEPSENDRKFLYSFVGFVPDDTRTILYFALTD